MMAGERIGLIAKPGAKLPIKPRLGAGPVRVLVRERRIVGLGIDELPERRHLDEIAAWRIECPVPAMPHDRAGSGKECLG
jgi:hypothetical protein